MIPQTTNSLLLLIRIDSGPPTATTAAQPAVLRLGFFHPVTICLRCLRSGFISQAADPNFAIRLLRHPHTNQKLSVLRTGGKIHITPTWLGKPPGTEHSCAANRAQILRSGHCRKGCPLIAIVIEHLAADTAGKLRAMEAIVVALQSLLIFFNRAQMRAVW